MCRIIAASHGTRNPFVFIKINWIKCLPHCLPIRISQLRATRVTLASTPQYTIRTGESMRMWPVSPGVICSAHITRKTLKNALRELVLLCVLLSPYLWRYGVCFSFFYVCECVLRVISGCFDSAAYFMRGFFVLRNAKKLDFEKKQKLLCRSTSRLIKIDKSHILGHIVLWRFRYGYI